MRQRGIRIAVLTNSLASTDSPAAHAGYARQRPQLLRMGVELFEYRPEPGLQHDLAHRWGRTSPARLHTKVTVQDRLRAIVGSLNQDPRSRAINTEAWITVDSAELATELAQLFDEGSDAHHAFKLELGDDGHTLAWRTQQRDEVVVYHEEPAAPWLRLWRSVLGLLIPEELL
jgi:putative cardiolipin synthase